MDIPGQNRSPSPGADAGRRQGKWRAMKRRIFIGCMLLAPLVSTAEKPGPKKPAVPNPFEKQVAGPRIDLIPAHERKFIPDKRKPFIPGEKHLKEFKQ